MHQTDELLRALYSMSAIFKHHVNGLSSSTRVISTPRSSFTLSAFARFALISLTPIPGKLPASDGRRKHNLFARLLPFQSEAKPKPTRQCRGYRHRHFQFATHKPNPAVGAAQNRIGL